MIKRKNKLVYYQLAGQFFTSRLCSKSIKAMQKNYKQNVSIYRIGSVLLPNIKKIFLGFREAVNSSKPLKTIYEENHDFSFMDALNNEVFEKFSKKLTQNLKKFAFGKIKSYIEVLATSRISDKFGEDYTKMIAKKTESISNRIFSLMTQISDKEKSSKKVPDLKLKNLLKQTPERKREIIIEYKCKELQKEINEIDNCEVYTKVIKAWQSFIFTKKTRRFKIESIAKVRFGHLARKILHACFDYTKRKTAERKRSFISTNLYLVKLVNKAFAAMKRFHIKAKVAESNHQRTKLILCKTLIDYWKKFVHVHRQSFYKRKIASSFNKTKTLQRFFKLLKIRAKEIQLEKNHEMLARMYFHDKTLEKSLFQLKQWVKQSRVKNSKKIRAEKVYFKKAAHAFLSALRQSCQFLAKNNQLKTLSKSFFSSFNKKKFLNKLIKKVQAKKADYKKISKSQTLYNANLLMKVIGTWWNNAKAKKETKLKKYRSFLVHCKNLIEKTFYGWKKIFPRERYKRYRTMRLKNNIDWNIIDSYFCEWIRIAAIRIKKSNDCIRLFRLKFAQKIFDSWKTISAKKQKKSRSRQQKLYRMELFIKKIHFNALAKYFQMRKKKNDDSYYADICFTERIFRKWNSLSKKKMMLKYLTKYYYSKYLFTRWKNYSFDYKYSQFARVFYSKKLKKRILSKWKRQIKRRKLNEEKMDSYIYYKNLKTTGLFFDNWVEKYHSLLLQRYGETA